MIKTTPTTEIALDTAGIAVGNNTEVEAFSADQCINTAPPNEMTAVKKEYSIVGDAFYAGINSDAAPTWLTNLIDSVVSTSVSNGLTDYDLLVQDVRNAIDSIDVAKNTYVEQINFTSLVDGIIGSHLSTLNVTYDGKFATIADLDVVKVDAESALATRISDLEAEFDSNINSRITSIQNTFASVDATFSDSIEALTTAFIDQESNLSGTASAVSGLQTYVGLDENSNPSGFGMLSRIDILEKQSDGSVDVLSNTYDVMSGIEDPNSDTSNDSLILDALPYVLWTNMEGSGAPSSTLRPFTDYTLDVPAASQAGILEGTMYVRSDFTDKDVDKYYKFNSGSWVSVDEQEYESSKNSIRDAHTGDVYIHYDNPEGTRNYLRSYKFIKTAVDVSAPYFSTDDEGYGWALITDTESQAIYLIALQSRDMADGKISHFYAWGDGPAGLEPTSYSVETKNAQYKTDEDGRYLDSAGNVTTNEADYVQLVSPTSENVSADNVALWFTSGILYKKGTSWSDKIEVPKFPGNGAFMSTGDILTVFDPVNGDTSNYWFNGSSWQSSGPSGIISKSKWFIDLDNAVYNPHGHVAQSMNDLSISSKVYADESILKVENKFAYDSVIKINDKYYKSGFGLDSSGISQVEDGDTEATAFDSEFWVNAKSFVLKNPDVPGVEARFNVTPTGLTLGVEHTEATKNNARGAYDSGEDYEKGDVVYFEGSSWIALVDSTNETPTAANLNWQILAEKGESAYDAWVKEPANTGKTEAEFLESLNAEDGVDGNTWFTYSGGVPPASLGNNGDFTLRDGRYVYLKVNGSWNYQYDLKGDTGTSGKGISSVTEQYRRNNNSTNYNSGYATGSWSNNFAGAGAISASYPYIWKRTVVYYTDGSNSGYMYTMIAARGDNGADGSNGSDGAPGSQGSRGSAVVTHKIYTTSTPDRIPPFNLNGYWDTSAPSGYGNEIDGDTLVVTNTHPTMGWTHIYKYASGWSPANVFTVNGSQIVNGTIVSDHLVTGSVTADKITFNSAYLSTESGVLSIASLTDVGNGKVFGNSTGTQTPAILIPAGGKVVLHGTLTAFGTTTESSSVSYTGTATTSDLSYVSIGSQISVGSATGSSCLLGGCQFVLTATNSSTITRWVRFKVNMSTSSITSPDSSLIYSYLTTKR